MQVTVSQLNSYVKTILQGDYALRDITVSGEISGLKTYSSGHVYFSLKDQDALIRCTFFRQYAARATFTPKDGMHVLARGSVSLYEKDGQYQLIVCAMQEDGLGLLYQQFEALKQRLEAEGLFDPAHKKPIPRFVRKIGVATSPSGAVFHDIVNVATRRCPGIQIVLAPVKVQGQDAAQSICNGIRYLEEREDVDLLIVGRGGGSMEDLWCFNDETLARTVYAAQKPVISAVGHETDFTICDFAADLRAPTPSAAAELAVFDFADVLQQVQETREELFSQMDGLQGRREMQLQTLAVRFRQAENVLAPYLERLQISRERLLSRTQERQQAQEKRMAALAGALEAKSPLKVLQRGYSAVTDTAGRAVYCTDGLSQGDTLHIRFFRGCAETVVKEVQP